MPCYVVVANQLCITMPCYDVIANQLCIVFDLGIAHEIRNEPQPPKRKREAKDP